ncbi:hypothetical protein DIS24_g12447 [Lasiodiplodia hormozganensis]|uniref:Uncharacterized protein n=1 Tax=Lasiodiplodia hormozganensis TaxID=869390 RepID=A0AA39TL61_9PEZI|nr:hypothetical protein DIS24_g12447 [Lasiodiplodia hormozganensis]
MPPTSEPPPDTEHRGYAAIENGERLLPAHKLWNAAALRYEKEAGSLAARHADDQSSNEHRKAIVQCLARPWSPFTWEELCDHFEGRFCLTYHYDEVLSFANKLVYDDCWDCAPWGYLFQFRDAVKNLDRPAKSKQRPYQVAEMLEACLEERTSWSEQDLALDAAISQLPRRLRGEIEASIIKCNYQLFLVAVTNAFPIPEDSFEYHLRRYHALKVVYAHMELLLEHFTETGAFAATIALPLRQYAWVIYNVVMRFLYHSRIFDPSNEFENRTLFGWTTGILWKWTRACQKFAVMLRALRDDHPFQPGDPYYSIRHERYREFTEFFKRHALTEEFYETKFMFGQLYKYYGDIEVSLEFIARLKKSLDDLRRASFAAETLRVLPHSADLIFLGLDDEPGEKDEVAQLYDRMRDFVDVREYAFCEEHGAIGDM